MNSEKQLALSNCDREPVHIPGRIQAFGAMLGYELQSGTIRYHSENLGPEVLGRDSELLGVNCEDVLPDRKIMHGIRGALGLPTISIQRDRIGLFEINDKLNDVSVYQAGPNVVVEFERGYAKTVGTQSPVAIVHTMMSAIRKGEGMQALLDSCVSALRHFAGHDRVMAYRFFDNGDGEVVAEAKGPAIDPYIGLRYPAWDIPTQVRQIMLRAPFRMIQDIHADHVALIQEADAIPLDMTFSHLRGVSPIHIEYLENMGVQSTMNISIIVHGQLWGLFAFHHYRPRCLKPDERSICELFGQLASMLVQQELENEKLLKLQKSRSTLVSLSVKDSGSLEQIVNQMSDELMNLVEADGMAYFGATSKMNSGSVPSDETMAGLRHLTNGTIVAVDSLESVGGLSDRNSCFGKSAGAMLLPLAGNECLAFFRDEVTQEIRWAGNKEKTVDDGPRLAPRGSFAEYCESVSGRCNVWTDSDISIAQEIRNELSRMAQVGSAELSMEQEKQKRYKDLLIAELNHRVRNTLALVRSIARQTTSHSTDSSQSLEQYVDSLERRLLALSSAHDLIGGSGLQWASIEGLVQASLRPFIGENSRVTMKASPIAVRADVAPVLSLLFHEMTSNAVKHGALSDNGESLTINWQADSGGASIEWIEQLSVDVSEPERRGFGFALIERALPYECNGRSSIHFDKKQLRVHFWLPAESIIGISRHSDIGTVSPSSKNTETLDLSRFQSALVVEDNMVLAMEVERLLRGAGIESVDAVPNRELAESAIARGQYDCAILDINLGDETSLPIAGLLVRSGIPVVLTSGYDSKYELPEDLMNLPRLVKPIGMAQLANALIAAESETRK